MSLISFCKRDRRGRDSMAVGYTTYAICASRHWCGELESCSARDVQHYVIKFCQWLAAGRWFFSGYSGLLTNKNDSQNITEILLKMALSNINPTKYNLNLTGVKDEIFMQSGTVLMGRNWLKQTFYPPWEGIVRILTVVIYVAHVAVIYYYALKIIHISVHWIRNTWRINMTTDHNKVIYKWVSMILNLLRLKFSAVKFGKRTESHRTKNYRTKSHKTPRTKSHNLYFLPWRTKSHGTKSHHLYFCLTCM